MHAPEVKVKASTITKQILIHIDDLNTVIKYFSIEILQRLIELENYDRRAIAHASAHLNVNNKNSKNVNNNVYKNQQNNR